jgi:pimeloyl-ACP methyl ester carboxylesterase
VNVVSTTDATDRRAVRRPPFWLLASEGPRAVAELGLYQAFRPWLARAPRGDGHRVLVLPGMGADDRSTRPLRRFLAELGYDVHGWGLGTNLPSPALIDRLRDRARAVVAGAGPGATISLVGWSLGGIYAREIAKATPERVRQVVTLGSPFRATPDEESNVDVLLRRFAPGREGDREARRRLGDEVPLPVPSTSVFTRFDGIVPWRACVDVTTGPHESLEVTGSHCGLGHHPAVLWIVADRLAQPAGQWHPLKVPPAMGRFVRLHPGRDAAG